MKLYLTIALALLGAMFYTMKLWAEPEVTCSGSCQKALQTTINQYRVANKLNAVQLSVSLPGNNGSILPTMNFYSGTVEMGGTVADGALNDQGQPINLMGIGSLAKSFTAAIILQLEAEGKLKLTDTVGMYLPQYPDWSNITIQQLLNMTSGIFDYENDSQIFWPKLYADPDYQWLPNEVLSISYNNTETTTNCPLGGNLCFKPAGSSWHYSNADYMLLAMIIKQVTGESLEDELNQRLLGPTSTLAQLDSTFYADYPYTGDQRARMVHQYASEFPSPDVTFMNLSWDEGAGAMLSTPEDLITWVRLLFQSNKVLAPAQQQQLEQLVCSKSNDPAILGQPVTQTSELCPMAYGLGIIQLYTKNNGLIWAYGGSDPGVNTAYFYYVKYNVVVAVQTPFENLHWVEFMNSINKDLGLPANIFPASLNTAANAF